MCGGYGAVGIGVDVLYGVEDEMVWSGLVGDGQSQFESEEGCETCGAGWYCE